MTRITRRRVGIAIAAAVPLGLAVPAMLPVSADVASFRMTGSAVAVELFQGSLQPGTLNFDTTNVSSPAASTAIDSTPHADALATFLFVGGAGNGPAEALGGALLDAELGSAANPTPVKSSPVDISGLAPYTFYASSDSGNRMDDRGATPPVPGNLPPFRLDAASYATHADRSPTATATVTGSGLSIDQLGVPGTSATSAGLGAAAARLRDLIAGLLAAHGDLSAAQQAEATPTSGPFLSVGSDTAGSAGEQQPAGAGESAQATLHDVGLAGGLIHIGSITVTATGSSDGTKVPAPASGAARLGDVSVAGMPATIDAHGIHVTGGASPDVIATINGALGPALQGLGIELVAGSSTDLQKTLGRPSTDYQINGLVVSYTVPGMPPVLLSLGHAQLFLGAQPVPQLSTEGFTGGSGAAAFNTASSGAPPGSTGTVGGSAGQGVSSGGAAPSAAAPAAPSAAAPAAPARTGPAKLVYAAADVLGRRGLLALTGVAEGLLLLSCLLTGLAARRAPSAAGFDPDLMR